MHPGTESPKNKNLVGGLIFIAVATSAPPFVNASWAQSASAGSESLDTVTVTSEAITTSGDTPPPVYAGGQVAAGGRLGILGEQDAMDVPFNVISYTSDLIENQQADTLADVLINDASVQSGLGYGNYAEKFLIRGYELDGEDISFGGLYGVLPRQIIDTSLAERVELFKGANAFTNGVTPTGSGVGGAINIEPKRAGEEPNLSVGTGYESDSYGEAFLDAGKRFGSDGQFGARIAVKRGRGDTAIDDEERRDTAAIVGLDYRGERARASLDVGYQKQFVDGGRSIVYAGSGLTEVPDAPDADTNYAPSWAYTRLESTFGMLRGEYDLNDNWTAFAGFGGNNTHESGQYSSPTVVNADGDATASRLGVPYRAKSLSSQVGLRGQLDTGPVSHQMNLAYSGFYRKTSTAYTLSSPAYDTNIYDPVSPAYPETAFSGGDLDDPDVRSRTRSNGAALSDTLGFLDDRVLLTLGARYQEIEVTNYTYEGNYDTGLSEYEVSPVYGVVVKPWGDNVSLYANHIEALQPGDIAPTAAINSGQTVGIVEAKQNEVGAKFDYGTIGGGIALFQIEQPQAFLDTKTGIYGYHGEQRNRGLELSLYGEPMPGVRLLSSATWLDPEVTDAEDASHNGNDAVGVPGYRYVLGGEWDLPRVHGLTATGRVVRNGPQYLDAANDLKIDAWTRLDLGFRYTMPLNDASLIWRANVENVTGENYWASATGGYLTQGEPRTLKLSATVEF